VREWVGRTAGALDGAAATAIDPTLPSPKALLEALGDELKRVAAHLPAKGELPDPDQLARHLEQQLARTAAPQLARLQSAWAQVREELLAAAGKAGQSLNDAQKIVKRAQGALDAALKAADDAEDLLCQAVREGRDAYGRAVAAAETAQREAAALRAAIDALPATLDAGAKAAWVEGATHWRAVRAGLREAQRLADDALAHAARPLTGPLADAARVALESGAGTALDQALLALAGPQLTKLEQAVVQGGADAEKAYADARAEIAAEVDGALNALATAWEAYSGGLRDAVAAADARAKEWRGEADGKLRVLREQLRSDLATLLQLASADELAAGARTLAARLEQDAKALLATAGTAAEAWAAAHAREVFAATEAYAKYLAEVFDPARIDAWIGDVQGRLPTRAEVERQAALLETRLAGAARGAAEAMAQRADGAVRALVRPVLARGDGVLRLVRAFGEAPRVPQLRFDVPGGVAPEIGYYFLGRENKLPVTLPRVDVSPIVARANEMASQTLNALELRLPTRSLLDRLAPPPLDSFDLRKIFPNFAGLRLADLFENVKLPRGAADRIQVRHGGDPQSLQGWMEIGVDERFSDTAGLFSFGGVSLRVRGGRFTATARLERAGDQPPRQSFRGEISGDWEVEVGGMLLVVFERTALRFDDAGHITFDLRPDRVRFPGPMAFLADLLSKFGYSDKGFSFQITPSGARLLLDLPLPDVQGGAFGLANLRLGARFELSVLPEFSVTGGANLASRQAPFTLTVAALGGAGWFDFSFRYVPSRRELSAQVSIGIMAAASLAVSLGPISGGVYAYFGIMVEYRYALGSQSRLSVSLVLYFVGRLSLLGIVDAYLEIGLQAQYTSGGGLLGRGYVSVKVRICWCFTLKISTSVSYTFGSTGGGTRSLATPQPAALLDATAPALLAATAPELLAAALPVGAAPAAPLAVDYDRAAKAFVDMFAWKES
jgi:hypothetical protein